MEELKNEIQKIILNLTMGRVTGNEATDQIMDAIKNDKTDNKNEEVENIEFQISILQEEMLDANEEEKKECRKKIDELIKKQEI